jgi:TRAP transporter TAXI family solute receptor
MDCEALATSGYRGIAGLAGMRHGQYRLTIPGTNIITTGGDGSVILKSALVVACCVVTVLAATAARAAELDKSIIIRAGKTDSPNHALARQFAEAVAVAVNGAYTLVVQESQGSVQNVIDAAKPQSPNYVFTAGPDVIATARRGQKPFAPNRRYNDIRALVPIPAQTLHWVVRQDSGITRLEDLAGHNFISGPKGSVAERVTTAALQTLGIDKQVQIMDLDAAAAPAALKAKQVSGFALAGAYPLPAIVDLARALPLRLIGLPKPALATVVAADETVTAETVPQDAYPGMTQPITTVAVPAGIYTTLQMSTATAYAITKAFWTQHAALAQRNPPWGAVTFGSLAMLKVKLHAGALRYYRERHVAVPKSLR